MFTGLRLTWDSRPPRAQRVIRSVCTFVSDSESPPGPGRMTARGKVTPNRSSPPASMPRNQIPGVPLSIPVPEPGRKRL